MQSMVRPGSQEEQVGRLVLAALLVLFIPSLPLGNFIMYPFVILSTWFHEMGHGLTALALGFGFEKLELLPDGSGVATTSAPVDVSGFAKALIAAGGPLGPAIVGSLLILASANQRVWRPTLIAFAGIIALSTLIWVRTLVGWIVLPLVAGVLVLIAWRAGDTITRFTLQFLGIHAALSMFGQWDYLMMESAVIGGQPMASDTGAMEQALLLPHWFWAGLIIVIASGMIGASLKYALRENNGPPRGPRFGGPKPPANVLQFKKRR